MKSILPKTRRGRTLLLVPLALVLAAMAGVYAAAATGNLASATNQSSRRFGNFGTGNTLYATQSGSLDATRKANIKFQNAENYDQSYEACKELGLDVLAHQFRVAVNATAVARQWAATELPAFYKGTFTGCRDALMDRSPPPFRKPDTVGHAAGH